MLLLFTLSCLSAVLPAGRPAPAGTHPFAPRPLLRRPAPASQEEDLPYAPIRRLIRDGEVALALEAAEAELAAHPRDAWLLERSGQLAFAVGKFARGEQALQTLATISETPAAVYLEIARLEAGATRRQQAAEAAGRALGANPRQKGARGVIARHQVFLKLYDEAVQTLRGWVEQGWPTAEERGVYGVALLRSGHARESLPFLRDWEAEREASPEDRSALGEALIAVGRPQEAADSLAAVLIDAPRCPRAYYLLGTALARLRQRDAARIVLEQYRRLAHLDESWAALRDVDSSGVRAWACLNRARILIDSDDYGGAVLEAGRAVKLDPADGRLTRAAAVQLIELEALDEARESLQRAVDAKLVPRALIVATLGEVERRAGRIEQARKLLDQALALEAGNLGALIGRGQVAFESDEGAGRARDYFQRAQRAAGGRWQPIYWMGRCLLEEGNARAALNAFDQAFRMARGAAPGVNAWLIVALTRNDLLDRAAELAAQSRQSGPVSSELLAAEIELARRRSAEGDVERLTAELDRSRAIDEALRDLRALAGPFRARGPALRKLAESHLRAGLTTTGLRYLYLARAAAPGDPSIHRRVAEVVGSDDPFVRAHALATVLDLQPDDVSARTALAKILVGLHAGLARAEKLAREALEREPSAAGHHLLGEVLLARGDRDGAAREARLALEAQPGEPGHEDLLRRAEVDDGQPGGR